MGIGYTYDADNRLTHISQGSVFDAGYEYYTSGNIATETVGGQFAARYSYDAAGELTGWIRPGGIQTNYAYDADGNRTTVVEGTSTTSYSYEAGSQKLLSSTGPGGTVTYTYDAKGALTGANSGWTYGWSDKGELDSINGPGSSATFTYDDSGRRTSKTIGGTTTNFIYDDEGRLIAEKSLSGAVIATYYYDSAGQPLSMKKDGSYYYFHLNQRGDVIKVTDAGGAVVASYAYDPWGNILESTGTFANEQPFRYAGYYYDGEIGLYYLQHRYYDPVIGRFISRDPAWDSSRFGVALNHYAYSNNNPVMGSDPIGLYWDGNLNYHRLLSRGRSGEDVRTAQRRLIARNYYLGPYGPSGRGDDGYFGGLTNTKVREFQRSRGLSVDGVVGPITWGALQQVFVPQPVGPYVSDISGWFHRALKRHAWEARQHAWTRVGLASIPWWFSKVNYGAPWDYKTRLGYYKPYYFMGRLYQGQDLGNLHYGHVGTAAEFSEGLLFQGGGAAQLSNAVIRRNRNGVANSLRNWRIWGDEPRDRAMIKRGIDLYYRDFNGPFNKTAYATLPRIVRRIYLGF